MSQTKVVSGVATKIYSFMDHKCVSYHQTDVVKFNDEEIILNSGGWRTNTTKLRMNQTSNQFDLGYNVFQKDFGWYVSFKDQIIEFADGMVIKR